MDHVNPNKLLLGPDGVHLTLDHVNRQVVIGKPGTDEEVFITYKEVYDRTVGYSRHWFTAAAFEWLVKQIPVVDEFFDDVRVALRFYHGKLVRIAYIGRWSTPAHRTGVLKYDPRLDTVEVDCMPSIRADEVLQIEDVQVAVAWSSGNKDLIEAALE